MEKGFHCLGPPELLEKKSVVLFTMVDNQIVQIENQTHFLLHQNWVYLTDIWNNPSKNNHISFYCTVYKLL